MQTDLKQLNEEQCLLLRLVAGLSQEDRIKRLLAVKGLSQAGVSRRHDVPLSTLNQTITGRRNEPCARRALSEALGMPEEVLFDHQDRVAA